jgi:hypothetical protein
MVFSNGYEKASREKGKMLPNAKLLLHPVLKPAKV